MSVQQALRKTSILGIAGLVAASGPVAPVVAQPAVRDGAPHHNTPDQALQDVAVIEAILRAAETGERVAPERIV